MTFSSCLNETDKRLILDSSVVINLLATGCAQRILDSLEATVGIGDCIIREIGIGIENGRNEADGLKKLIEGRHIDIVTLGSDASELFFELVSGRTQHSLGDGEAATIALAHQTKGTAVIDERKATRVVGAHFPNLRVATTIDILAHPSVQDSIGIKGLAELTLQALRQARMQVREHQFDWVINLIGSDNIELCPSLIRLARTRAKIPPVQIVS